MVADARSFAVPRRMVPTLIAAMLPTAAQNSLRCGVICVDGQAPDARSDEERPAGCRSAGDAIDASRGDRVSVWCDSAVSWFASGAVMGVGGPHPYSYAEHSSQTVDRDHQDVVLAIRTRHRTASAPRRDHLRRRRDSHTACSCTRARWRTS